ncbi:MAG: RES domain-containing protein [Betaproteobacteria bacterium]|nr:RES domain-containing protein [Betaproteobacteria bacterium]
MSQIWRISNYADLDGLGGLKAGQRWHSRGRRIIYCAPTPAAAILETLVNFEIDSIDELPLTYQLLAIDLPDDISRQRIELTDLPKDWLATKRLASTRQIGDVWRAEAEYPALEVPSAVAPMTWNTLLNPALLPDTGVRITGISRYPFDPRLFRNIAP